MTDQVPGGRPGRRITRGLALPLLAAVPALAVRFSGASPAPALVALLFAAAVVAAAFLLTWGTELAELDLGEGLALALLALIAVLPEYAVDVVFAWKAGQDPGTWAPLALANVTGANRLLIGAGWSVMALFAIRAARRASYPGTDVAPPEPARGRFGAGGAAVILHRVQVVELAFLAVASVYGLTLALRRTLTLLDTVLLFAIFTAYLWRVRHAGNAGEAEDADAAADEASELFGPAAAVAGLPARRRRWVTAGMLLAAAAIIVVVAGPFASSLVDTGRQLHVNDFLLVQWVAPLASETPEFIAVLLLAWRMQASAGLGALISSKINQWTILVGILPLVFMISAGSWRGLPLDTVQREELLLTAAQSVFAVSLVITGWLTAAGAWTLLGLFTARFALAWTLPGPARGTERLILAGVYLMLAVVLLTARRAAARDVLAVGLAGRPAAGKAEAAATTDRSAAGTPARPERRNP